MKKIFLSLLVASGILSCAEKETDTDFAKYVNPFVGNADNGHTFPGACAPFGMIQASPESGNASWRYCSGFNYEDEAIFGFAQNHLNGTGVPDLGDVLLLPFSGNIANGEYKAKIDKKKQVAKPGYYSVFLPDSDIHVEVTATERTAFYRWTYNSDEKARLLVDLQSGLVTSPEALQNRVISADT